MRFDNTTINGLLVSKVLDTRIDASVAQELKMALLHHFQPEPQTVILNLEAVTFIDSSGLGALVSVLKNRGNGGDLIISGSKGAVASMFKLTRMDKVFRVFATTEEALQAVSK